MLNKTPAISDNVEKQGPLVLWIIFTAQLNMLSRIYRYTHTHIKSDLRPVDLESTHTQIQ